MIRFPIKPLRPTLNRGHSLAKGIVFCMLFMERGGVTVFDVSGKSNNGTLIGGATRIKTPFGEGIDFDGVDGYSSTTSQDLNFPGSFSAFIWSKGPGAGASGVVGKYDYGASQRSWTISGFTPDKFEAIVSADGGTSNRKRYASSIVTFDNTWHQIGFVFTKNNLDLYVDGLLDSNPTKVQDGTVNSVLNSTVPIVMGAFLNSGSPAFYYDGGLDHVLVWDRPLSQNEVRQLYYDPFAMFKFPHFLYLAAPPTFPLTGVEVLHPIPPAVKLNERLFRTDRRDWRSAQKTASVWMHEFNTLTFRIRAANMAAFMTFLIANKANSITLNIPGVQPFIRAAESNVCYMPNHTEPRRIAQFYWQMSITFLRVPT